MPRIKYSYQKRKAGLRKNRICLKTEENSRVNLFRSKATLERVGKAAIANEIPKTPIGRDWRSLAKLKTVKEPLASVEAIIVITIKLICEIAKLIILGTIITKIFLIFLSRQGIKNLSLYLKPKIKTIGN